MKTLCTPDNEAEAAAIAALLEQEAISCMIQSYHDTAYDGLFQGQLGWGVIRVDDSDYDAAAELLHAWRSIPPDDA